MVSGGSTRMQCLFCFSGGVPQKTLSLCGITLSEGGVDVMLSILKSTLCCWAALSIWQLLQLIPNVLSLYNGMTCISYSVVKLTLMYVSMHEMSVQLIWCVWAVSLIVYFVTLALAYTAFTLNFSVVSIHWGYCCSLPQNPRPTETWHPGGPTTSQELWLMTLLAVLNFSNLKWILCMLVWHMQVDETEEVPL